MAFGMRAEKPQESGLPAAPYAGKAGSALFKNEGLAALHCIPRITFEIF